MTTSQLTVASSLAFVAFVKLVVRKQQFKIHKSQPPTNIYQEMLNNTYSLLCSHFLLFIFHCSPSYVDTAVNSTTFRANFQGLTPCCIYITQTINLCPYGMHTQNLIIPKSNFSVPFCTELGKKSVWLQKTVLYQFSKFAKNHAIKSKN